MAIARGDAVLVAGKRTLYVAVGRLESVGRVLTGLRVSVREMTCRQKATGSSTSSLDETS
jgi:hypothetical protein